MKKQVVDFHAIEKKIFFIRGHKVMLDSHLADLYGVETRILIRAMKRNVSRFPMDFMFQLNQQENENLRSQIGISSLAYGGRRYLPYAFTQEGVAMLSGVLKSPRAIRVNVAIMRAFVRLRSLIVSSKDMAKKIEDLEKKFEEHDGQLHDVFNAIRYLMNIPIEHKKVHGFQK